MLRKIKKKIFFYFFFLKLPFFLSADVTDQLERGYWASYNVPYFPEVYRQSGYPAFVNKHGVEFSYQMAPRAEIFRRDQGKVVDLESFKAIMRYNDYKMILMLKEIPIKLFVLVEISAQDLVLVDVMILKLLPINYKLK